MIEVPSAEFSVPIETRNQILTQIFELDRATLYGLSLSAAAALSGCTSTDDIRDTISASYCRFVTTPFRFGVVQCTESYLRE
jgi:hypothetical protein